MVKPSPEKLLVLRWFSGLVLPSQEVFGPLGLVMLVFGSSWFFMFLLRTSGENLSSRRLMSFC